MNKDILKNNQLIAIFMGAEKTDIKGLQKPIWYPIMGESFQENKLSYHESWDWLMPVIDKLKSVTEEPEELDVLRDVLWWGSIENVFDSVVDNIIDYNNTNKN